MLLKCEDILQNPLPARKGAMVTPNWRTWTLRKKRRAWTKCQPICLNLHGDLVPSSTSLIQRMSRYQQPLHHAPPAWEGEQMSDKRKKEEGGMEDKVGGREGEGRKEEVCVCILRCTSWANVHAPVVMTVLQ